MSSITRFLLRPLAMLFCLLFAVAPPSATSASVTSSAAENAADIELKNELAEPGTLVLMRHAEAPGFSDPDGFQLEDCSTQRNLSARGRQQASDIGQLLRRHGVNSAAVYSSQWCRCLDTATLLQLGAVTPLAELNSFFETPQQQASQTAQLSDWLSRQNRTGLLLLVTHQVNITALSGVYPASGELIVLRRGDDGSLQLRGRVRTDSLPRVVFDRS